MTINNGSKLNLKALILAGGLGTRLRNVVSDRPKPMAEARGKPFLEFLIEILKNQGLQQIVLCVSYRADLIQDYFGNGSRWGMQINYAVEEVPLGTAGAIKNACPWIDGRFLVLNGDSYQQVDLCAMLVYHDELYRKNPSTIGTIAARFISECSSSGTLNLDHRHQIRGFYEKGSSGPGWINAGIYILEPDTLNWIPENQVVSLEKQTFPDILKQNLILSAYPISGYFVDIGTPQGYDSFRRHIEGKRYDHSE